MSTSLAKNEGKNAAKNAAENAAKSSDQNPQVAAANVSEFAADVLRGLSQNKNAKSVSSRWFYDDKGSALFSEIMGLDEYYLTLKETQILSASAKRIASFLPQEKLRLVELGAGDGKKTTILLRSFVDMQIDFTYTPVDVSPSALEVLCERVTQSLPGLKCAPIVGDNVSVLSKINKRERLMVIFLGSSIGNYNLEEAQSFFVKMGQLLRPGDFLFTGFDLVKAEARLIPAYSDARGVTAEFNYNLLDRMNRELGADFNRARFRHEATFNKSTMAMESWLISQGEQDVFIQALEKSFHFEDGEWIRTEVSQKFKPEQISAFADTAGFRVIENFTDDASDFLDALWERQP